jgi:Predicted ATP-dependent endonuclease of the OLD family
MNTENCHYCVPERAGNIDHQPGYISEESNGNRRAPASQQNLATDYRPRVMTRITTFFSKRGYRGVTSDNLIKIQNLIDELLLDFKFNFTEDLPHFELRRKESNQIINDINFMSSGETQLLTLSLDLVLICEMWNLQGTKGTLLVDEPDSHLHPDMQQRFAKFLVSLNNEYSCRIIIATHSTTLLSALGYHGNDCTSVIYLSNTTDLTATPFDKYLKKLSTCLGGHALMGPLFNVPLLLVEGDDDYRIWSEIPRHGKVHIAVIPCDGAEILNYQETLEKLFASILGNVDKPIGYALLDGDKPLPNTSQRYIKFLKLACHESENLYLTDQVLSQLNYTWETACNRVVEESKNYGQKSENLAKIKLLDKRTDDFKNIINEIAKILDDKQLTWAFRLGKILGAERPKGQLEDYLGSELMKELWGEKAVTPVTRAHEVM